MWNPDLPMKPLLDRFFAGYYGKAAPYVRQYFEELHALIRDNPRVVVGPADKAQSQDQAFSAGIYDAQAKKALAGISKTVAAVVGDQWQWYDVGTWTPGPGQYLWLAPGRFDKKAHAANPSLEAVFLDQVEISRVE